MSKIRKILEKYADDIEMSNGSITMKTEEVFIHEEDFDKLEEELQELFDSIKYKKKRFNKVDDVIGI